MKEKTLFSLLVRLFFIKKPSKRSTYHQNVVTKIVDGDTINLKTPILGTTKVRLLSIDAPETNYRGQSQSPWGEEASQYLSDLLPMGTKISLITDHDEKDQYDRLLAHVYKGKSNINRQMLEQGLAVTYFLYPNQKYFRAYQSALLEAQNNQRGMWNKKNPIPELPFEFRSRISKKTPNKYIGDYDQKIYVEPNRYHEIPIERRVFFLSRSDAKKAGYKQNL